MLQLVDAGGHKKYCNQWALQWRIVIVLQYYVKWSSARSVARRMRVDIRSIATNGALRWRIKQ